MQPKSASGLRPGRQAPDAGDGQSPLWPQNRPQARRCRRRPGDRLHRRGVWEIKKGGRCLALPPDSFTAPRTEPLSVEASGRSELPTKRYALLWAQWPVAPAVPNILGYPFRLVSLYHKAGFLSSIGRDRSKTLNISLPSFSWP